LSKSDPVEYIEPQPGPQTEFLKSSADIAIYGGQAGGGKSWALLASAGSFHDIKGYGAVVFRRESPQITNEGGLWDESMAMYPLLGAKPNLSTLDWRFPSGANIGFRHLQHESDMLSWQGTQLAMIGFDELTHFTENQFWYLLSRNRSMCTWVDSAGKTHVIRPFMRATTNPVPEDDPVGGWVRRLIDWWIDKESGYAIPERSGVIRWLARVSGELMFADTAEELQRKLPARADIRPKSLTFIPAKLSDNPAMLRVNPDYMSTLMALPTIERQRLAEGNWNAERVGAEWPAEYFTNIMWPHAWPPTFDVEVAFLDPSKGKTDRSDYSAIVSVGWRSNKFWVDADIKRRPTDVIVKDGIAFAEGRELAAFGVEANAFQDLLLPLFAHYAREMNIIPPPMIPITNTIHKETRIRRIGPRLAHDLIRIKDNESGRILMRQLKEFPDGANDDGPDALDGALQLLMAVSQVRKKNQQTQYQQEYD
jgi:hypothetical protein